jgi:hypothetical protein
MAVEQYGRRLLAECQEESLEEVGCALLDIAPLGNVPAPPPILPPLPSHLVHLRTATTSKPNTDMR